MAILQLASLSSPTHLAASAAAAAQTGRCQRQELSAAATHGCPSTSWQAGRCKQRLRICARGGKGPPRQGRGYDARKASVEGVRKRIGNRELDQDGWIQVAVSDDLIQGKNKAIIHDNNGYVIVKRDTSLYTIRANCTSCQFPVVEGKVEDVKNGAEEDITIDCPLCHTKVSLIDGKVVVWCPKDGPIQWVVGTLKEKAPAVPAKVYPTRQSKSGRIYVKLMGINELKIP